MRTLQVVAGLALSTALIITGSPLSAAPEQTRRSTRQRASHTQKKPPQHKPSTAASLPCGDYGGFQVLLDRQGFSPGQIDDRPGTNLTRALAAFQAAHNLPVSSTPDCDAWHALGGDTAGDLITTYTITADDVKGPFETIPHGMMEQEKLPALGYTSVQELLGEKFHASPALLQRMNRGVAFDEGRTIKVPAVTPFDPAVKPTPDPAAADMRIQVTREDSALRATRGDGALVFYAPVTTGSIHDPLPAGDYTVTGVQWHPVFHYNPDLFWDAKPNDDKATIKAGPNNPVGVVWIGLTLEHYGLHGTPEPAAIGRTQSHGCVRLTNWDAAHVAGLVKPGTRVQFR